MSVTDPGTIRGDTVKFESPTGLIGVSDQWRGCTAACLALPAGELILFREEDGTVCLYIVFEQREQWHAVAVLVMKKGGLEMRRKEFKPQPTRALAENRAKGIIRQWLQQETPEV